MIFYYTTTTQILKNLSLLFTGMHQDRSTRINNPWLVPSVEEFFFLCCPECVFRSKEESSFQTHALQNHPQSSALFYTNFPHAADEVKVEKCDPDDRNNDQDNNDSEDSESLDCAKCSKTFKTLFKLKQHIKIIHSQKSECQHCGKSFKEYALKRHIKTAHADKEVKTFKCDLCDFSSHARKYLKTHKLNCHQKDTFKHTCDSCQKKFPFPYLLKSHKCLNLAKAEDLPKTINTPVDCSECGQILKGKPYLVNHFLKHHGKVPPGYEDREKFICDHCPSIFLHEDSLKKHIELKHRAPSDRTTCYQCKQSFSDERYLIQHYQSVHNSIPPGFDDKEALICDQCPSIFFNKKSLAMHSKKKHFKGKRVVEEAVSDAKRVKKCPHCEKTFITNVNYIEHIRSKHENNTPFQCDECHRSFGTKSKLRVHKKNMHQRVKCDECGQEICNVFILRRHKASVHGIRPTNVLNCDYCPAFFNHKKVIDRHVAKQHPETLIIS